MPPRILALILTLVQSNRAILIGSLDSTADAVMGASAVAASAASPTTALFTRNLLIECNPPATPGADSVVIATSFAIRARKRVSTSNKAGVNGRRSEFVVYCGFGGN